MSTSSTVSWPPGAPLWTFSWEVIDGDSEGVVFRNVFYKGKKVLYKASLPMIRVQYDYGAGPYKDQLSGTNMQGPVQVYEETGHNFLVVDSFHLIGNYRLLNRWLFLRNGFIQPQLFSAGLQYPANHRHHVYWRFDFDIDGASNNLALAYDPSVSTNWGYGPGWRPVEGEEAIYRGFNPLWAVLNKEAGIPGYVIQPGDFDGHSDNFSPFDGSLVVYHAEEDLKGRMGKPYDDELYQQVTGEPTNGKDLVLWYVAHLAHDASDHGDEWHVCGPILRPFGY